MYIIIWTDGKAQRWISVREAGLLVFSSIVVGDVELGWVRLFFLGGKPGKDAQQT